MFSKAPGSYLSSTIYIIEKEVVDSTQPKTWDNDIFVLSGIT